MLKLSLFWIFESGMITRFRKENNNKKKHKIILYISVFYGCRKQNMRCKKQFTIHLTKNTKEKVNKKKGKKKNQTQVSLHTTFDYLGWGPFLRFQPLFYHNWLSNMKRVSTQNSVKNFYILKKLFSITVIRY